MGTAALMAAITHVQWTKGDAAGPANANWIDKARAAVEQFFLSIPSAQLQGFATEVILGAGLLVALALITRAALQSSETDLRQHPSLLILSLASFILNFVAIAGWIPASGCRTELVTRLGGFCRVRCGCGLF